MPYLHHCNKILLLPVILASYLSGCSLAPLEPLEPKQEATQAEQGPTMEEQAKIDFDAALGAMKGGNQREAEQLFTSMTERYPTYAGPWVNLGILYQRKEKFDEAETAFKKALELNEDNPEIYNQLGYFYRDRGKFHLAREMYKQGLKKDADYASLHRNLGILFDMYLAQPKEAIKHYQKYVKLNPEDKQVATWKADLLQRLIRQN